MTDVALIKQIIETHHFTNLHAEDDRGFRETFWQVVHPCRDDPGLLLKLAIAVFTNQPEALRQIDWSRPADSGFLPYVKSVLKDYQAQGGSVFRTSAYKYPMPPELRGMNALDCLFDVVLAPMQRALDELRPRDGDTLEAVHIRLCGCHGVGEFLSGQIIRYLKYAPLLRSASDWKSFVAKGPGCERGLNLFYGRPITAKWSRPLFCAAIEKARQRLNPELAKHGIAPLDGQNTNNLFCETFKLRRAIERGGKPSRPYKPNGKPMPPPIPGFSSRIETSIDATAQLVTDTETVPAHILEDQSHDTHEQSRDTSEQKAKETETRQSETRPKPSPPEGEEEPGGRGSKHATEQDTHSHDNAGKPFDDAWLLRKGYAFTCAFPYTLPDGTLLYEQRRYDLKPDIPAIKGRPRKRFLIRRQVDGQWPGIFGTGPRRIPYNWPALMRAGPGENVFVPEGEAKVDALAKAGWLATTVVSHDWKPECIASLTGQHVFVLADHDDPALPGKDKDGKILAESARKALAGVTASIRVVPYAYLWEYLPAETRGEAPRPHEDIKNWLEERKGDAARLLDICRKIPAEGFSTPQRAPIRSWAGKPAPEQEFTVPDRIPAEQVFLLSGEGGGGKSEMAEHLDAAHVLGREWMGVVPRQGPAVHIECEDAMSVLHRRLAVVSSHYGVPIEIFDDDLHLFSLVEHDSILATVSKNGVIEPTAVYRWLYEMAGDIKPVQISIASVANIFAGSEIDRIQVQQFIKLLNRIPALTKGSLVLVSQPSLTGIASTNVSHEGLSGTTQWHNAVRGRAVVKHIRPKDGDNSIIDTGLRTITFHKNQYGPPVAGITVCWTNGMFLPVAGSTTIAGAERAAAVEGMALALLARFNAQNRQLSIVPNPNNYAAKEFAETPEAEAAGFTTKDFRAALDRLLGRDEIENAKDPSSKGKRERYHLRTKPKGGPA
jgi:RecA-family ATPase